MNVLNESEEEEQRRSQFTWRLACRLGLPNATQTHTAGAARDGNRAGYRLKAAAAARGRGPTQVGLPLSSVSSHFSLSRLSAARSGGAAREPAPHAGRVAPDP